MEIQTEWITVPQAMQILQVTSRTTLYKYALKYNIRVSKPLGRIYYNLTDIKATMDKKAVKMGI
jgi:hypothetical protein